MRVHTSEEEINTFDGPELEPDQLKFPCGFCDKKFLTENILSFHTLYRHKEEKRRNVSCEFCGRVFAWKNRKNLKKHVLSVHKVEGYTLEEIYSQSEKDTVNNFMAFFESF